MMTQWERALYIVAAIVTVICMIAGVMLLATPARALEGKGFTEQILSCVGPSDVTVNVKRGELVLVRVAPECATKTPYVFKASKDRVLHFKTWGRGATYRHAIHINVN